MSEGDFAAGFVFCGLIFAVVGGITYANTRANISDAELYRFCMEKGIALEECKIPVKPFNPTATK